MSDVVRLLVAPLTAALARLRGPGAPAPAPPALTSRPGPDDVRRELADLLGSLVGKVPPDILSRYESIHRRMLAMLPHLGRLEGTSEDLYILHRTAADYLPVAVRSYLKVARAGGAERPLADGRTPHQVLLEQLDLIESRLADLGAALEGEDLDQLLAHGRFLEARFGERGNAGLRPDGAEGAVRYEEGGAEA